MADQLFLRRIYPNKPDHYSVINLDGESVGYIYRSDSAPPGAPAWLWGVAFSHYPSAPNQSGRLASLDEAKAAVRAAWPRYRAKLSNAQYAAGRAHNREVRERIHGRPLKPS